MTDTNDLLTRYPRCQNYNAGGRNSSHESLEYSPEVVRTAKQLRWMQYSYPQIRRILIAEFNAAPSCGSIRRWCLGYLRNTEPEDLLTQGEVAMALRMAPDHASVNRHSVLSKPILNRDIQGRLMKGRIN